MSESGPRILLVSELGGGSGHVMRLKPIAESLRRQGATVVCAMRDIVTARPLAAAGFDVLPAPRLLEGLNTALRAANFAELMIRAGFERRDQTMVHAAAWRDFLSLINPDLMVADFAPGAMLGARLMNVKRVSVGTGFALPPDVTPLPVFAPWLEAPKDRLDAAERQVLGAINAALLHHRRQPLGKLSELVNTGCDTLCTYPELDHYASRGGSPNYVGPIYDTPLNRPPSWPERGGPRIFAYLAAQSAHLAQTIAALSAVNAGTLLVIQGPVDPETIAARGPNLQISSLPVNLNLALPQAQLVICHANLGLVSQALKAGVPMVLLPRNPEQIGTAIRVAAMGAGLMLRGPVTDTRIKAAIAQALDDRVMAARTKEVAVKFAAHESKIAAESAAGVILERAKNQNPI